MLQQVVFSQDAPDTSFFVLALPFSKSYCNTALNVILETAYIANISNSTYSQTKTQLWKEKNEWTPPPPHQFIPYLQWIIVDRPNFSSPICLRKAFYVSDIQVFLVAWQFIHSCEHVQCHSTGGGYLFLTTYISASGFDTFLTSLFNKFAWMKKPLIKVSICHNLPVALKSNP